MARQAFDPSIGKWIPDQLGLHGEILSHTNQANQTKEQRAGPLLQMKNVSSSTLAVVECLSLLAGST